MRLMLNELVDKAACLLGLRVEEAQVQALDTAPGEPGAVQNGPKLSKRQMQRVEECERHINQLRRAQGTVDDEVPS